MDQRPSAGLQPASSCPRLSAVGSADALSFPIEPAFSKLRRLYESAGHRVIESMWQNTQTLLDAITPSDARGFFGHCGYKTL